MSLVVPESDRNQSPSLNFQQAVDHSSFWCRSNPEFYLSAERPSRLTAPSGPFVGHSLIGTTGRLIMRIRSRSRQLGRRLRAVPGDIILHPSFSTCGAATVRPAPGSSWGAFSLSFFPTPFCALLHPLFLCFVLFFRFYNEEEAGTLLSIIHARLDTSSTRLSVTCHPLLSRAATSPLPRSSVTVATERPPHGMHTAGYPRQS